jgi:NUMOD3 motif-containing protein
MSKSDSYVYIIFRPNGIPCYVGKGRGDRWKRTIQRAHNPHLTAIAKQAGGDLPLVKIRYGLTDQESSSIEMAFISAIGREENGGPLVNLTDGGEGTSGAVMTQEWRKNRSAKAKEMWKNPDQIKRHADRMSGNSYRKGAQLTQEHRSKIAKSLIGNNRTLGFVHTEESRKNMSIAAKGRPKSLEHRAAIGRAHIGMKRSEESRKRMSAAQQGKTMSLETREKIRLSALGKTRSDETRAKMRSKTTERWKNPEYAKKVSESNKRSHKPMTPEHREAVIAANKRRAKRTQ